MPFIQTEIASVKSSLNIKKRLLLDLFLHFFSVARWIIYSLVFKCTNGISVYAIAKTHLENLLMLFFFWCIPMHVISEEPWKLSILKANWNETIKIQRTNKQNKTNIIFLFLQKQSKFSHQKSKKKPMKSKTNTEKTSTLAQRLKAAAVGAKSNC